MSGDGDLLGKPYQDLYSDYYQNDALLKRKLSAVQTVNCMVRVLGNLVVDKLIDVGAGEGSVLLEIGQRALARELYAVEVSESGIEAIKTKAIPLLNLVQLFDGYRIPYPDKYFDLATTIHVLEHVEHESGYFYGRFAECLGAHTSRFHWSTVSEFDGRSLKAKDTGILIFT